MKDSFTVVALPGDGIGREVVPAAVEVLKSCASSHDIEIEVQELAAGGQAIEKYGDPLPPAVMEACQSAGIVLLGAVGDDRFSGNLPHLRPERALLQLRGELKLYANLRPVKPYPALLEASPLKRNLIEGVDILIVRELTGGVYFGKPRGLETRPEGRVGFNSEIYYDYEIERIARVAFESSRLRRNHVSSVDKSNVMESSQLWRAVVGEVARDYTDVALEHILVDTCAMRLISHPRGFDVILTNNMFGDILSDEAAMLTGSIGMLPSASLGREEAGKRIALYEPVHGTAPDIAGKDMANPLAAIASVALLFRYSLTRDNVAGRIEAAIEKVLNEGWRTADIAKPSEKPIGTREMTDKVLEQLQSGE